MPVVAMSDFIWEDHGNGGKKETTSSFFFWLLYMWDQTCTTALEIQS